MILFLYQVVEWSIYFNNFNNNNDIDISLHDISDRRFINI
jgi:hypothetical protein